MPKTGKGGIEYASDKREAEKLLKEFCQRIEYDFEWITAATWATTVDIALDPETGLETAEKSLVEDMNEKRGALAKGRRRDAIGAKRSALIALADADDDGFRTSTLDLFRQACAQYIDGGQIDMTFSDALTSAQYEVLRTEWTRLGTLSGQVAASPFSRFESLEAEDKDAKGKGSVGKTLATRKVQGNVFVTVVTVRFNVHVDIRG
ncbi:hypothetical protein [Kitasatospora sp. NPDC004289]